MIWQKKARRDQILAVVIQELEDDPLQKFYSAFVVMSLIPFMVFIYILTIWLNNAEALAGYVGFILLLSLFISICGLAVGYGIIKKMLDKILYYTARKKKHSALKTRFVAAITHKFRNPLYMLSANIDELLQSEKEAPISAQAEAKKTLEECHNITGRMSDLVMNLIDLYKIESGMIKLSKNRVDIAKILKEKLEYFKFLAEKKHLNIQLDLKERDFSVLGEEKKIAQMIESLVNNSIMSTSEKSRVTFKLFKEKEFIRLEFYDHAKALSEIEAAEIFDKFERIESGQKTVSLDLAIAKDIVEVHKGSIWVEGEKGKGNKVVVLLPQTGK
ncbi:MAG: HAMP domain-containing sensor histidine kinase [Candidatus Omnitrophota bacterium]